MLAKGIGNCFAISKSFRNLENSGTKHFPEFLMLEWYRENANYTDIMRDTQNLILTIKQHLDQYNKQTSTKHIIYQDKKIELANQWPILSFEDLFKKYANIEITNILTDESLFETAKQKGYSIDNTTWGALFDQIFLNEIEPYLSDQPLFLTDFPSRISPLCTPYNDKPYLAQRFELYIANMELANGNTENTNIETISKVFEQEKKHRKRNNLITPPIDQKFLEALQNMQHTSYAGIGLGIDRLAMLFSNCTEIAAFQEV